MNFEYVWFTFDTKKSIYFHRFPYATAHGIHNDFDVQQIILQLHGCGVYITRMVIENAVLM